MVSLGVIQYSFEAGFNGAALRRARSDMALSRSCAVVTRLQRGRAPESAEWTTAEVAVVAVAMLQRGRAPESAE